MLRLTRIALVPAVIVCLLCFDGALLAQPAPDQAPGQLPAQPALAPAQPAPTARGARAATSRASSGPTSTPTKFSLNFKDTQLDAVLNYFSQTLGFEILKDGPIDARVTLMSKQPVSAEEAVTFLNAVLKANGFTAVREGNMLHIGSRDKAKKGNLPVHFGNNPADIPETEELITQVIPIENVSAIRLRDDLKPLIGDADVTANEGSNTIIVTDSSSSIHRLVEIISQIDAHEATVSEMRIVQLKHSSATDVAKIIESLMKGGAPAAAGGNPQQQMQMQMQMQQQGGPKPPGGGGGSERHGNTVIAVADERTNTLLVMGSVNSLKTVDEIIKQLDADVPNPAPAVEMRVYVLNYAAADATAKLINTMFKPASSGDDSIYSYIFSNRFGNNDQKKVVNITAVSDDRTNSIVVTGPPDKFKEVEHLIDQLDTSPTVTQDLRVIHLKYADAIDVAKLVQDMFQPKKDDGTRSPFLFILDSPPTEQKVKGTTINVTSDTRTNSVLVSAPKEMLNTIEKIVKELDSDSTTEDSLFIYHLRNGQAAHLEYTLNVLFGNVSSQNQNNQQNGQNQQNNPNQQNNNQLNLNGNSNNSSSGNQSSQSTNRNQQRGRGVSPSIAQAANELTGKVLVVAEPDTNALLVTTASKYEKQVRKIIDDLDQPVRQVLIKVLMAEVTHDNSDDLGLDFSVLNLRPSGQGQSAVTNFGLPTNGLVVSVLESNFAETLHALAVRGKLDVLSRPYILASDNQDASISVGQSVPFVTESRLDTNNNTINTVQYRDIGIILSVTPHINPDGLVILDVSPEISSMTQTTIQLSPGVNSPVFQKRDANSRVGIVDGQTIVIGGLMQDQNTTTLQKVPILGDIPLLGALFRRNQVEKTKTELLIFLTPHVVQKPDTLQMMSNDEMKGTKLTPKAVAPGVFDDHMQGMQRGQLPQTRPAEPISPVNQIDLSEPQEKPAP
jgi:general secretion pathway protein D